MTAEELIASLRDRDILLSAEDGEVVVRSRPGRLTDEVLDLLRARKQEVLAALRRGGTARFPSSELQRAYAVGRTLAGQIGNIGCHVYHEYDATVLDLARLERAWNEVVRRHVALRAVLSPDLATLAAEDRPDYAIAVTDLRDADPKTAAVSLAEMRATLSHRVHDPTRWPLFDIRATLLPDGHTRLHLGIDLIAVDAASVVQVLREWELAYEGAALPPVPAGFDEYACRAASHADGAAMAAAEAYWQRRIAAGLPPPPAMPLACNPAQIAAPRFRRRQGRLEAAPWTTLKRCAGAAGLTPSTLLCAAFAEILRRWSNQEAFSLTLTLFNRLPLLPAVEQMIGEFTSTLLLPVEPPADATFSARALALQARLREDLPHRVFSGLRVLRAARMQGAPVVFTSLLAQQALSGAGLPTAWLGTCAYSVSQTPQVWLDHQVMEEQGALVFTWDAVEALFPDGLLDAMFAALSGLLQALAADPTLLDAAAPVPLPENQRRRRERVNATAVPRPAPPLHASFLAQAACSPDAPAVIAGSATLSYATLLRRANAVAARLQAAGLRPGELVAIAMPKGWEQVAGTLGVLLAGGAFLPIDTTLPSARIAALLSDAGVGLALVSTASPALPHGAAALCVDGSETDRSSQPAAPAPDSLAYVIYTSGSTGMPKGVMIAHGAAQNTIADINARFALGAQDRVLGLSNLSFDLAIYDIFGPLSAGGAVVLPDPALLRDPAHWRALMLEHRVTIWNSVPLLMQMLIEHGPDAHLPDALQLVLLSGDWIPLTLPDEIRARAPRARVVSLGGATEAAIWSILFPIERIDPAWRSIPYGRPMDNQAIHVLDAALAPCPDWTEGEIFIGGAGLAQGYWNDPEKTAWHFLRHPVTGERLYRTGDRGRFVPDGWVEFRGRQDTQVKIRGHRVELGEIEEALRRHPLVAEAVVVATEEATRRTLVGYVVPKSAPPPPEPARLAPGTPMPEDVIVARGGSGAALAAFRAELTAIDRASTAAMAAALRRLDVFAAPGEAWRAVDIVARRGLRPGVAGLLGRWLACLAEDGLLEEATDGTYRARLALPVASLPVPLVGDPLAGYLAACWDALPALLRGEADPLSLLFPQGDWRIAEALYAVNPAAALVNRQAAHLVQALIAGTGSTVRVLEIGAGIGSLTEALLPVLPAGRCDYVFTDVTPFFQAGARRKFASFPFLRFAVLDVLREPLAQGFVPHGCDLLVASNVLHNAADPVAALRLLRPLLAPGGVLLLIEATRNTRAHAVSIGFIEGLAQATRADGPFLKLPAWRAALAEAGFTDIASGRAPEDAPNDIGLDLIAARVPWPTPAEKADAFARALAGMGPEALRAHLARDLPGHLIPGAFVRLDRLPLNANGKLDRAALPRPAARTLDATPRLSDAEDAVAEAWHGVLNRANIGPHDNFFELGGDSLLIVQLQQALSERFGRAVAVVDLFANPTVAAMAAHLGAPASGQAMRDAVADRVARRRAARESAPS
jgi:pyochelin synthetase